MVRDDLYSINVPIYFRCPISLDVMKSPVSLCTGVTYDRSSIQRWFDGGNNTCPATMQVLQSKELVPNHTLQRLIKLWSENNTTHAPPSSNTRVAETIHLLQAHIQRHTNASSGTTTTSLIIEQCATRLVAIAGEGEENAAQVSAEGRRLLPWLVKVVDKFEGDLGLLEKIVVLCNVLLRNCNSKEKELGPEHRERVHSLVFGNSATWILTCLKKGRLELRIAVVNFLNLIASNLRLDINSCSLLQANEDAYSHLLRTLSDAQALDASLTLLTRLAASKRNRIKMVRAGCVRTLARALLSEDENPKVVEKAVKLMEMASRCEEGRDEICANEGCVIRALVKSLLKVSSLATEHAVTVLWVVCCLYGNKRAVQVVSENNGMAKVLVVLQSGCSQTVRGMCGDLLRALRSCVKAPAAACLTCYYNSNTTHIMPF